MSKYSSYKQQQLLTEAWRSFAIVEQQPVAATPPATKLVAGGNTQLPVKEKGLSQISRQQLFDPKFITQLKTLINGKKVQDAVDYITNTLNTNPPSSDKEEVINIANDLYKRGRTYVVAAKPQTYTQKKGLSEKQLGPIGSAIKQTVSLAEKGLMNLGQGDIDTALTHLKANSATIVLLGMIVANLTNMAATNRYEDIPDTLSLIDQIKNSLYLSSPKDLIKIFQPTPRTTNESTEYDDAVLDDGTLVCAGCLEELLESERTIIQEAKYQGRTVTLNKPTKGDVKKFKVYVKDPSTGNVKKVNFGDPNMKIKKNIPARRKSFRARHNCDNPGPKTKARYWSCKKW